MRVAALAVSFAFDEDAYHATVEARGGRDNVGIEGTGPSDYRFHVVTGTALRVFDSKTDPPGNAAQVFLGWQKWHDKTGAVKFEVSEERALFGPFGKLRDDNPDVLVFWAGRQDVHGLRIRSAVNGVELPKPLRGRVYWEGKYPPWLVDLRTLLTPIKGHLVSAEAWWGALSGHDYPDHYHPDNLAVPTSAEEWDTLHSALAARALVISNLYHVVARAKVVDLDAADDNARSFSTSGSPTEGPGQHDSLHVDF